MSDLEACFHQLKARDWTSKETDTFWCEVHNFQDISDAFPFRKISSGVVRMLCLPLSNAEVERVFSQVTEVKSKLRTNIKTELLESILYCKFGLSGVA